MSRLDIWRNRSPREQAAIAVVGGAALALLAFAFVWLPLHRAQARLAAELPALRLSVAQMRAEVEEARRLRALPPRSFSDTPTTLIAGGSLAQGLPGVRLTALDAKRVRATLPEGNWNALVAWIERAQTAHNLSVESASIEALPTAGRIRAELTLARP